MDFVSPIEVDHLIKSLRRQRLQDLGKEQWLNQHSTVIRLNQQCVLEARTEGREELTRDLIVEHGKTPVLVQDLFSVFVWRKQILPELTKRDSIVVYSLGYHELILVNLLELIMYHGNGGESLEGTALDLVDYCVQSVTQLIGLVHSGYLDADHKEGVAVENMDYKLGLHCTSLLYYLIDKLELLPLGIATRLVRFHDTPCLLSELLHCRPWQRRTVNGFEKFVEGKWTQVFGDEFLKVAKVEAQAWFAFRQLLFNNQAMQNYDWNEFRCREVSKCLGLINDVLLDQLTPLVQLKQFLSTLTIQKPPTNGQQSKKASFLLEEIPELQNEYLKEIQEYGKKNLIDQQEKFFNDPSVTGPMARQLTEAYNIEKVLELQGDTQEKKPNTSTKGLSSTNKCGECSLPAEKKCSSCELAYYCCRQCQVKNWPTHKSFCKLNAKRL